MLIVAHNAVNSLHVVTWLGLAQDILDSWGGLIQIIMHVLWGYNSSQVPPTGWVKLDGMERRMRRRRASWSPSTSRPGNGLARRRYPSG